MSQKYGVNFGENRKIYMKEDRQDLIHQNYRHFHSICENRDNTTCLLYCTLCCYDNK